MATTIVTKKGSGAPAASDLVEGELAVDTTNGRLYTENSSAAVVELGSNPSGNITFGDNGKAIFGAGSDLQIYHDGADSYINDSGMGDLKLGGNQLQLNNAAQTKNYIYAVDGAQVELKYNNALKLATTATGIDITGTVTADGLTVKNPNVSGEQTILNIENAVNTGTIGKITFNQTDDRMGISNEASGSLSFDTATLERLNIAANGDISFYEDTGTTAKFFWDASAESLGIGTSSPAAPLSISGSSAGEYDALILRNSNAAASGQSTALIFEVSTGTSGDEAASVAKISGLRTGSGSTGDLLFHTTLAGVSSERLRIDSSGNVGIGTDSPDSKLVISEGASATGLEINPLDSNERIDIYGFDRGSNVYRDLRFIADEFRIETGTSSASERLRIDSSGNVGIGESDPDSTLTVKGSSHTNFQVKSNSESTKAFIQTVQDSDVRIGSSTNHPVSFYQNGSEAMRIDASGNLLVGCTGLPSLGTGGAGFETGQSGDRTILQLGTTVTSTLAVARFYNSNGAVGDITLAGSATTYNTSSDQRLKENIADADDAGSKIDAIQVRKFDWIADGSHQDYGMVAQELLEVAPEAVSAPEDPDEMMGVDYSKLVPMMLKEIQSLRARVAQLEF